MENETKTQGVEDNNTEAEEVVTGDESDTDESSDNTTNTGQKESKEETLEAKAARLRRQLAQTEKKMGKTEKPVKQTKSGVLDWGQKAFLATNGIKGENEISLVSEIMAHTGKDLDEVVESKYFQAELKELREAKATDNAVVSGSKRSTQTSRDTVEYWIAKGELPPKDQRELRQKVVNARVAAEKSRNVFYNG